MELLERVRNAPGIIFRSDAAKRLGVSEEEYAELKRIILSQDYIKPGAMQGTSIINRRADDDGTERMEIVSDRPMTQKEMEAYFNVDNVNSFLKMTWIKTGGSQNFRYSVLITYPIKDFYTKEELGKRISELLPSFTRQKLPSPISPAERSLWLDISDLHCGSTIRNSIYGTNIDRDSVKQSLVNVADQARKKKDRYEQLFVVVAGDQVDGWKGETTRGGHKLGSLPNKDQFDIYLDAMQEFYRIVLSEGYAGKITIINVDNSNHSGHSMSYIANRALEYWLSSQFRNIEFISNDLPLFTYDYGDHCFAFSHGKDDEHMSKPMPFKLDKHTDNFLYEYFRHHNKLEKHLHLIKGDLHQFGIEYGGFGRYVNLPAITKGSNYGELNFTRSRPGAVLEVVERRGRDVETTTVMLDR